MTEAPFLSVIVPVYNAEPYLAKCVDSIRNQTFQDLEVLLVDDGSRDQSGRLCDRYEALDPRIRVFHKENGGQSSARNLALDQARGRYITFVDSDDWIEPDAYRAMVALAQETEAPMVCAGRYNVIDGVREPGLCPVKREVIPAGEMLRRMFLWDNCDSAPCDKIFERRLFDSLRFPEESGSEDVGLLYRLVDLAGSVAMLDQPIYNYLQRPGSTSCQGLNEKTFLFEKRASEVFAFARERYSELETEARYFYLAAVSYSVISADQADADSRSRYAAQTGRSRRELRRNLKFLLTAPVFGRQERLTDLLLAVNLYRPLRRVYHAFR